LGATLFELYTGAHLFPVFDLKNLPLQVDDLNKQEPFDSEFIEKLQPTIDHLHMLKLNMGELPDPKIIESAPSTIRALFRKGANGAYEIAYPPSKVGKLWEKEVKKEGRDYMGMQLWEGRVYKAAERKGQDIAAASAVIDLIGPMLRLKPQDRPTADQLLENFD